MKFKIQKVIAALLFAVGIFLFSVLYTVYSLKIQDCNSENGIAILEIMGQDFIYTFENEV